MSSTPPTPPPAPPGNNLQHVAQIWKIAVGACAAFTAVFTAGFQAGQHYGVISAQEKLNTASAQLAKAEAETTIQRERAATSAEHLKQSIEQSTALKAQLQIDQDQMAAIHDRLEQSNACAYFQKQIATLEAQIMDIKTGKRNRYDKFAGNVTIQLDPEKRAEEKRLERERDHIELSQLQERVIAYVQKLEKCTANSSHKPRTVSAVKITSPQ